MVAGVMPASPVHPPALYNGTKPTPSQQKEDGKRGKKAHKMAPCRGYTQGWTEVWGSPQLFL